MPGGWRRVWTSTTLVDSALAGSHWAVSFFSACLSFSDSGTATAITITHKPTTSHLVQRPAGISAIFLRLLIASPRVSPGRPLPQSGRSLLATVTGRGRRPDPCEYVDPHGDLRPTNCLSAGIARPLK